MRDRHVQQQLRHTWGRSVRALRMQAGLTQEETATVLGMALKAYQRLETGKHNPTLETMGRVAAALRQPVAAFLYSEAESAAPAQPPLPSGWRWQLTGSTRVASLLPADEGGYELTWLGHAAAVIRGADALAMQDMILLAQSRTREAEPQWSLWRSGLTQPWVGKTVLVPGYFAPDRWGLMQILSVGIDDPDQVARARRIDDATPPMERAFRVLLQPLDGSESGWAVGHNAAQLGIMAEQVALLPATGR